MQKDDDFGRLVGYVEEKTILEERLRKMEAFRGTIKDLIFRRVQRDYSSRLNVLRDKFRPTMMEIVKKLGQLDAEQSKLQSKLEEQNDLLAELRFRNEIGEFEETAFREQEDHHLMRLEDISNESDVLRQTIGDYLFYVHDDADFRQMASAEAILERLESEYQAHREYAAQRATSMDSDAGDWDDSDEPYTDAELEEDGDEFPTPAASTMTSLSDRSGPMALPAIGGTSASSQMPPPPPPPKLPGRQRNVPNRRLPHQKRLPTGKVIRRAPKSGN